MKHQKKNVMKNIISTVKMFAIALSVTIMTGCVHDDKYNAPDVSAYQCGNPEANQDLFKGYTSISLEQLKGMTQNQAIDQEIYVEGYVSSSDRTGNIYKYIYLQDKPVNPTQGLVISVDAVSTYTKYPQGAKVYIKLKGLAMGQYGGFVQLGEMSNAGGTFGRITEKSLATNMIKDCNVVETITPKEMTLDEMGSRNDQYVGCLIVVKDAEFQQRELCSQYAPEGTSVDKRLRDNTSNVTTRVARNSGYSSFANKNLPTGNGDFIAILSKYNSAYQFYIVDDKDLADMTGPRIDGLEAPCQADAAATAKTVAEVKTYYNGTMVQIADNATLTGVVTGNDAAGNLYKYIYVQDETGGIKVNINATDLYLDRRFQIGRTVTIALKDLYINEKNGEVQLGELYQGNVGQIAQDKMYKHFFRTDRGIQSVVPTVKTIESLTKEDVGRYITIKGVQVADMDLGKTYAAAGTTSSRTLEDCSGNTIQLSTSGYADFGTRDFPFPASSTEMDLGKGDVTGILSYYNGKYQIWILNLRGADFDGARCDGTLPTKADVIYKDGFDNNLSNWTAVNVTGNQIWSTTTYGNPRPSAYFDGGRQANEDWLISNAISLTGFKDTFFSFETDGRFSGNPLEVYVTENYTGDVKTTNWVKADNAVFDTDLGGFAGFVSSGKISLANFEGKSIRIAFKYTSVQGASTTWELDNVEVKGYKN